MVLEFRKSQVTSGTRRIFRARVYSAALLPIEQTEMTDAERDARTVFEWQQSVLAYVEFRMGDPWRRLHRPGQRFHDVRQHWLEVFRTCAGAFNSCGVAAGTASAAKGESGIGRETSFNDSPLKKPPQSVRLAAALRIAERRRA